MAMPVVVEYYAKPGHEEQVAALLVDHWRTLQEEGFATDQPAFLMRHPDDAALFVEVFEWKDEDGPDAAWDNPRIAEMWNEIQSHCEEDIEPEYFNAITAITPGY